MTFYDGYIIKSHSIYITDIEGNEWKLCEEVHVMAILTNRHTYEQRVKVRLYLSTGESVTVNMARNQLIADPVRILTKYGLTLAPTREYTTTLAEVLLDTEATAARQTFHDRLGWSFAKGSRRFYAEKVLGDTAPSTYLHHKRLKPLGTYVDWQKGMETLLKGRPELQLALTIGASAPIAALLYKERILDLVSIFALIGQSGTGKTTSLSLMASIWGRIGYQNGIVDTLLDTQNYFFANLGKKYGFPCFIDETSAQPAWDFTSVLYQLSMGKERGRCNPDGTPKPVNHWSGSIVFTGERSLFDQTNGNEGLFARLVEFGLQWTKDGEEAEKIAQFCNANYGTAYIPLIEYLLQLNIADLRVQYGAARDTLLQKITPLTSVDHRLLKQYSMLLMTSRIIADVWNFPIKEQGIVRLLVETHHGNPLRNRPAYIYEALTTQILANSGKFPNEDAVGSAPAIWGERSTYKYQPCVYIIAKHFEDFLQATGATVSTDLLRQLHNCGYIIKIGDRFKINHTIERVKAKCYCIALDQATSPLKSKVLTKPTASLQNRKYLLSEEEEKAQSNGSNAEII